MGFLKAIPDLGLCEGRWVTAFGTHRCCSYRASEAFEPPCGHVHRLCATCVYALERGMGTWDKTEDILPFNAPRNAPSLPESADGAFLTHPSASAIAAVRKGSHGRSARRTERVPLHVAFAGIAAISALIAVGVPSPLVTASTALGAASLLYAVALTHTWHR